MSEALAPVASAIGVSNEIEDSPVKKERAAIEDEVGVIK